VEKLQVGDMKLKREDFKPVFTDEVLKLHARHRLLVSWRRLGLVSQSSVDSADCRRAIAYGMSNSLPWVIPERLLRYEGLVALVKRAESWGVTFRLLPAGWYEHRGDVAMTYHSEERSYVFFENQPLDVFHTTDTICHEIVHSTGVRLKRLKALSIQNREETPYWMEEGVAVVGALRLGHVLDLPRIANLSPAQVETMSLDALERHSGTQLDRTVIDARAREAVRLLTHDLELGA